MITVTKTGGFFRVSVATAARLLLTENELATLVQRGSEALALVHQANSHDCTGAAHIPAEVHADPRLDA